MKVKTKVRAGNTRISVCQVRGPGLIGPIGPGRPGGPGLKPLPLAY